MSVTEHPGVASWRMASEVDAGQFDRVEVILGVAASVLGAIGLALSVVPGTEATQGASIVIIVMAAVLALVMLAHLRTRRLGVRSATSSDPTPSGLAHVEIHRVGRWAVLRGLSVYVDGTKVGKLSSGSAERFDVVPGTRMVTVTMDYFMSSEPLAVHVAPGAVARLRCESPGVLSGTPVGVFGRGTWRLSLESPEAISSSGD